jgi:hypothetical protein
MRRSAPQARVHADPLGWRRAQAVSSGDSTPAPSSRPPLIAKIPHSRRWRVSGRWRSSSFLPTRAPPSGTLRPTVYSSASTIRRSWSPTPNGAAALRARASSSSSTSRCDRRPVPADLRANDLAHWQTRLITGDASEASAALARSGRRLVSPGGVDTSRAELGFHRAVGVDDPDGHVMQLVEP